MCGRRRSLISDQCVASRGNPHALPPAPRSPSPLSCPRTRRLAVPSRGSRAACGRLRPAGTERRVLTVVRGAAAGHHVPLVRSPVSGPLGRVRVSAVVSRAAVRLRVRVSAAASVRIPPGFIREGAGFPGPMASPGVAPGSRAPSSPARAFRPRLSDWPGGRGAPARLTVVWICSGRVGVEARAPAGGLERSRGVREGGGLQPGRRPGHTAPPASSCWRTRPHTSSASARPRVQFDSRWLGVAGLRGASRVHGAPRAPSSHSAHLPSSFKRA